MTLFTEKDTETETFVKEIASIVKRLGNPVSTILLDSPCCVFQVPEVDGIIGYQLVRNCAVVLGDPICLPENTAYLDYEYQDMLQEVEKVRLIAQQQFSYLQITLNNDLEYPLLTYIQKNSSWHI